MAASKAYSGPIHMTMVSTSPAASTRPLSPGVCRRTTRRQQVCIKVDLFPLLDHNQDLWTTALRRGLTVDLSEQGMLLSRGGFLPEGSVVRLFFRLPDHQTRPVSCYAKVIRSDLRNRPRYGLKFIGLSPVDANRIGRFTATFSAKTAAAPRPASST